MESRMNIARMIATGMSGGGAGTWTPDKPLTGGAVPALWVEAADNLFTDAGTTPAVNNGDLIYTWASKTPATVNFVQETEDKRPTLAIVAGVNFVRSDGLNDEMRATIASGENKTLFLVSKKNSEAGAASKSFFGFGNNGAIYTKSTDAAPAQQFRYQLNQAASVVPLGGTVTNLSIVTLLYNSASECVPRIDGVSGSAFYPNDVFSTAVDFFIGSRRSGSQLIDADYFAIIMYQSSLSIADCEKVEAYLAEKIANPT